MYTFLPLCPYPTGRATTLPEPAESWSRLPGVLQAARPRAVFCPPVSPPPGLLGVVAHGQVNTEPGVWVLTWVKLSTPSQRTQAGGLVLPHFMDEQLRLREVVCPKQPGHMWQSPDLNPGP